MSVAQDSDGTWKATVIHAGSHALVARSESRATACSIAAVAIKKIKAGAQLRSVSLKATKAKAEARALREKNNPLSSLDEQPWPAAIDQYVPLPERLMKRHGLASPLIVPRPPYGKPTVKIPAEYKPRGSAKRWTCKLNVALDMLKPGQSVWVPAEGEGSTARHEASARATGIADKRGYTFARTIEIINGATGTRIWRIT